MIVVNAHWEKRNLGVSCIEILLEAKDPLEKALLAFTNSSTEYQIIKFPTTRPELIFLVQENGFKFTEIQIVCERTAQTPILDKMPTRFVNSIHCEISNGDQKKDIEKNIDSGMFKTDRVSIDPHFTKFQSANRYRGWLADELHQGASLYSLIHNTSSIGFFILRNHGNGDYRSPLGGIFSEFQSKGYGLCLNYHEIKQATSLGAKTITVAYSSNNPAVGTINRMLGYREKPSSYVFVRHKL